MYMLGAYYCVLASEQQRDVTITVTVHSMFLNFSGNCLSQLLTGSDVNWAPRSALVF